MKNTSGSQRRPNRGGIKVEQDQKQQRVATSMDMDTEIKELITQHEELLQSGHENQAGCRTCFRTLFSGSERTSAAFYARIQLRITFNVTKLRSKLEGFMCNSMWSGAFFSASFRAVFRECKTLPASPINHLGWHVCAALGRPCTVTTA